MKNKLVHPNNLTLSASGSEIKLAAGENEALSTFTMTAYTGAMVALRGWYFPVVIDLKGIKAVGKKSRPILFMHDPARIVGHTTNIKIGETVEIEGVISGASAEARQVVESGKNGFPWQASIGASADRVVFIDEGKTALVNGAEHKGPFYLVRKSTLCESSFVPLGADDDTTAQIAANAAVLNKEFVVMEFEAWLTEKGFVLADLGDTQLATLKAAFDAKDAKPKVEAAVTPPVIDNGIEAARKAQADETRRVAAIRAACAGKHADIEAKAIEENWPAMQAEVEVLRAERPKAPAIGSGTPAATNKTLEAALCLSLGSSKMPEDMLVRQYGEQTVTAAYPLRNIGMRRLLEKCCEMEGKSVPVAFGNDTIRAAFTTTSLPGILGNVANKSGLAAFLAVDPVSTRISAAKTVNDFKAATAYRLTMTGELELVGESGELKNAVGLTEESITRQAKTRGAVITLTREMMVNDDLGAFTDMIQMLYRKAALSREKALFTLLLANTGAFFASGNKNNKTGGTSAFSIDALTAAEQVFLDQTDAAGDPVLISPKTLLVPTALKTLATQLMATLEYRDTTASTKYATKNPHAGKWNVETSPYMSNANITGNSTATWYLMSDPSDVAALEIAYLNGNQTPTVEVGELDFNHLGMGWRIFWDFAPNFGDFRAAVRNVGS